MRPSSQASSTIAISLVLLAAAGCGGGNGRSVESDINTPANAQLPAGQAPPDRMLVATDPTFWEETGGLVPGLPEIPTFPGAVLVGSSQQNRRGQPIEGFRIKWTTSDTVEAVMKWYGQALPGLGWQFRRSNDGAMSEQEAEISLGPLEGYLAAEAQSGGGAEIVVALQTGLDLLAPAQDGLAVDLKTRTADRPTAGAPDDGPSFSFGAAGDFAGGDPFDQTLAAIKRAQPSFMLALGDLSYSTEEAAWCGKWTTSFPRLFLLAGNHDSGESPGGNINNYLAACPRPPAAVSGSYGKQYFFDYPTNAPLARFIMVAPGLGNKYLAGLDTNYTKGSEGYAFVEGAIDSARANGIRWVFVGMHKNFITPMEKPDEVSRDRLFMSMLLSKRVDVILQAHEHGYARSWPLAVTGVGCRAIVPNDFNAQCIADSDDSYARGTGTIFQILGTGGKKGRGLYRLDPEYPYFAKSTVKTNGFGLFRVSASSVHFAFERSAGKAFADTYAILDSLPQK